MVTCVYTRVVIKIRKQPRSWKQDGLSKSYLTT